MTSDYEKRQIEYEKRQKEEDAEERQEEALVGVTTGTVKHDIKNPAEMKMKMHNATDMHFECPPDLKKGDDVKVTLKADLTHRGQHTFDFKRDDQGICLPGEALSKLHGDIHSSHDIHIKIDNIDVKKFKPSIDLMTGDHIRIIVEKA